MKNLSTGQVARAAGNITQLEYLESVGGSGRADLCVFWFSIGRWKDQSGNMVIGGGWLTRCLIMAGKVAPACCRVVDFILSMVWGVPDGAWSRSPLPISDGFGCSASCFAFGFLDRIKRIGLDGSSEGFCPQRVADPFIYPQIRNAINADFNSPDVSGSLEMRGCES